MSIPAAVFHQDLRMLMALGVGAVLLLFLLGIIWKLRRNLKTLRQREGRPERSEEDLAHGLDLLRAITEGTSDAIFAKDCHGRYIMANPAAANLVGKTPEEVIGCTDADLFCAATAARIVADDSRVMETGETRTVENTTSGKNDVARVYSTTRGPLLDGAGAVAGVFGVARDITERKRDEEKLRESEERFRAIFEQAPLGISEGEIATARLISANQRYADILGYNLDELRDLTFRDYTHPEDLEKDLAQFQRLAAGEIQTYTMEKRYIRKDGAIIWVNLTVSALPALGDNPPTCLAVLDDITERKRAEEALNAQALRYKTLMETSTDSIYVMDENGDLQEANAAFRRRRGYTAADLKGLNVADWDAQADREQIRERIRKMRDGGSVFETRHRSKDGSIFDVEVCATRARINGDRLLFCVTRDITERKRTEERLREYERVVEGLEEMIVVVDRDYHYLLANRAFLNFRGLEREELIGRGVAEVLGPEAFAGVAGKLSECLTGKTIQYEMRYRFHDGRERDLFVSYLPIEGRDGIDRVACVLQDVTDRKRAEEELRRSEEKFKTLFGIAPIGIAFLDSGMNIVDCNRALERMSGLSRKDLLGKAWRQRTFLNSDRSPRLGRDRVTERGVLEREHVNGVETGAVLENGDIVWAEVSVAPLAIPDASAVVIMHDITERKKAHEQLRVLSRRLFQVQEEERRHLARELHDEIGQALTAVKMNLAPAKRGEARTSSVRHREAITLLDNLIRQVRQISLDLHPSLLDDLGLAPALRSLLEQQTRRAGLRAQFSAADPLEEIGREIQTTAFRIAQEAITNVLRHAHAEFVALFVVTNENQLRMKIVDDGAGFDAAKTNGGSPKRATFGLTGMKERAALLGGEVSITSSPGQGTTVEVSLPIKENGSA